MITLIEFFIKLYKYIELILHLYPRKKYIVNNKTNRIYCGQYTKNYLKVENMC